MPYDYDDLPEHLYDASDAITERLIVAKSLDYGEQMEAEAEAAYTDAARVEIPHLMAVATMLRLASQIERGNYRDAVASYVRLLKLRRQFADYLAPDVQSTILTLVIFNVSAMLQLPDASLRQVNGLIDQMEQAHREAGESLAAIYFSRAQVAAERGDLRGLREWQERWQTAERGEFFDPEFEARFQAEFYGTYDRERALEFLDTIDGQFPDSAAYFDVKRADLLVRLGRADEALAAAREAAAAYSPEELAEDADLGWLLRALEPDRDAALSLMAACPLVFADGGADAPPEELFTLASGARLLLADPASAAEGAALRERAWELAAAYDARNETTYHADLLNAFWFPPA